jgi:hypothetical protein
MRSVGRTDGSDGDVKAARLRGTLINHVAPTSIIRFIRDALDHYPKMYPIPLALSLFPFHSLFSSRPFFTRFAAQ